MAESEKQLMHRKKGAPFGNQNALTHGRYTAEAKALKRYVRELQRDARATIRLVNDSSQFEAS
jgi:uncharacterized protein YjcR